MTVPSAGPPSPGFHLLETMRHEAWTGLRHRELHLDRLARSAAHYGFALDRDATRTALVAELAGAGDRRVRLRAFPDGTRAIECADLPADRPGPVRLALDDEPVDSRADWPHHKTSRRAPYDRRRARRPDVDDVILRNERGEVTEVTVANLAVRLDGRWWTPPAGHGALPGVERGRLVAGGVLAERVLLPADLHRAEELAVLSALRGRRRAVLVPDRGHRSGR